MKFRKIDLSISHAAGKFYQITAHYRGKDVTTYTYDKDLFFFFYKDADKVKHLDAQRRRYYKVKHLDAKRHCYNKIVAAFKNSF